jgi:hypothetical protein
MGRSSVALLRPAVLGLGLLLVASTAAPAVLATARPTSSPASQAQTAHGAGVTNRPPTFDQARERSTATQRPRRHIIVNDLPTNPLRAPLYQPKLHSPSVKAPKGPSAPTAIAEVPTPVTPTTTGPVVEAASGAGTPDPLSPNALEPPDPWVAAGPDTIVQATNVGLRMTDRSLGTVKNVSLQDFFLGPDLLNSGYQAATFDPHVVFDSLHGRWVATEASFDCLPSLSDGVSVGTGYIDVAVSDNADPRLGWSIVSIPFADQIPDYPGLGTSTDKVVLSANLFGLVADGAALLGCRPDEATPLGAEVDILGWAQLLGTGTPDFDYYNHSNSSQVAADDWTYRPALQVPAATSTVHGIVERTGGAIGYFSVTGLPPGHTVLTVSTLPSSTIAGFGPTPPAPKQPGPPLTITNALDGRPTDAIWQNNRLVFTSTFGCDPTGGIAEIRDCVRVSELSTSTVTPTLTQDFVVGEEAEDLYMPGIGLSGGSDLHVVWTRSSATLADFPSTYAAYQLKGAALKTLTGKLEITHGTASYGGTRWGDYVGVAQDPQVSDAVWTADEYATAGGNPGGDWATEVSQLRTFAGASYTPITPLRILDTRIAGSGGAFVANIARSFSVAGAGAGAIPANAIAVTGNVTIVNQTAAGYLSVTPNLTSNPTSSTINFPVGDVRANNFSLPLGPSGKLSAVYKAVAGKTTQVIVDITGYFLPGNTHATFHPLAVPARVLDTRPGTGLVGVFHANTPRTLVVRALGGVPPEATAITGNLTVVGQTKAGYLSVTPEVPTSTPPTSTLNFPLGDIRANGLTADLNASGALSITYSAAAGATTNVILDVTGYYTDAPTGLLFYPLNPGRMMDSRVTILSGGVPAGVLHANVYKQLDTDGHWGVPVGAGGVTGNLTVVGQTQAGYLADTPTAAVGISTLNFPLGDIRANGITVPLGSGNQYIVYRAATGQTTNAILDVTGYFAP